MKRRDFVALLGGVAAEVPTSILLRASEVIE
jgi:hypothetical protein